VGYLPLEEAPCAAVLPSCSRGRSPGPRCPRSPRPLYAFAESLPAVRDAIATHAWAAIAAGELRPYGIDQHSVAGIDVVTAICDVYEAAWLRTAVATTRSEREAHDDQG
jgi:hypothetical protein